MADFCKQCSEQIFGDDFGDLANPDRTEWLHTICEGCGDAVVDNTGQCFARDCLKHHGDRAPWEELEEIKDEKEPS